MKKFAVLTSILALAACGGHGGESDFVNPDAEIYRAANVSTNAISSNKHITNMVSGLLVENGGNNVVAPSANRSSTTTFNGKTYDYYRLDDVVFATGELDDDNNPVYFKFYVQDDGRIDKIGWEGDGENWAAQRGTGDQDEIFTETKENTNFKNDITLQTYGDLKYADFGIMHMEFDEDDEHIIVDNAFAGGYQVMSIDKNNINGVTEFNGRAVGGVFTEYGGSGSGGTEEASEYLPLATDDAKLTFDNGTETLKMNFENWYDVTLTANGDTKNITFSNAPDSLNNKFKFSQNNYDNFTANGQYYWQDGVRGTYKSDVYGKNTNPSEATAVVYVGESTHENIGGNNVLRETNFSAAFGGIR